AEQIAKDCQAKSAIIEEIKTERKEFQPPMFFNLSLLQATANQLYHFSPEQTLNVLQQLYLNGFISYPRSDSQVVTPEEAKLFPGILQQLGRFDCYKELLPPPRASILQNKRYVNAAKVSDHYAIVPTEQVPDLARLSGEERKLYDLIVKRLIAAYYDEAIFAYTQVITVVGEHKFLSKGTQLLQEGWRKVIFAAHAEKLNSVTGDDEEDMKEMLPAGLQTGQMGIMQKIEVRESKTHPPKRFTEGQLITLMKTAGKSLDNEELEKVLERTQGLGTEATRAGIIAVLKERGYIQVRKNLVFAAPKGIMLVEALGDSILSSAEMTAKWEQRLNEIGKGTASPQQFMEQVKLLTSKLVADAIEQQKQWSFSVSPALQETAAAKSRGSRTAKSRGSKFSASRDSPAANSPIGSCKICGADVIERDKFYACTNSPTCRFSVSKRILGKSVSKTNAVKLLKAGESAVIKGFKKGDKQFDAALKWDEAAKTIKFVSSQDKQ
ncbi:MAG: topoisomerase, partial [Bacilli bacterium]|nr:topoisomerase [Bacilli bacterium]